MTNILEHAKSEAIFRRAQEVMPGGNTRTTVFMKPHPIYMARGEGARIQDIDGHWYCDFDNNFTSLIHGHNFAPVVEALRRQAGLGTSFGAPTESEVLLAELLCERVPYFEQVRFMNSGTEAVMNAIKAARAFTGRPGIAKIEGAYHGSYDFAQVSLDTGPDTWGARHPARVAYDLGTPKSVLENVVVLPLNDIEAARELLLDHMSQLAGILIDPLPSRVGLIPPTTEFLIFLREFSRKHGLLLISDEVLSFRLSWRGAMTMSGVEPDLCAFGKIIGGGMPIGAVAGPARFMAVFDPTNVKPGVSQAGTFTANPMTMVAGISAMRALTPQSVDQLNTLGAYARQRLRQSFDKACFRGQVTGIGSLFRLHFKDGPIASYRDVYPTPKERENMSRLVAFARNHGIILSSIGLGALSTPMTRADVDELAEVIFRGLQILKQSD